MRTYRTLCALVRLFATPGPGQLLLILALLAGLALHDLRAAGATALVGSAVVRVLRGRRRDDGADVDGNGAMGTSLRSLEPQCLRPMDYTAAPR
jgi:hypothetical protein